MTDASSAPVTPLKTDQVFVVVLVQLCESININMLFPFLAFMVEDFGYGGDELGYYAGALASCFCGAQFLSSMAWGKVSDSYGRKPGIIVGTFGAGIGMLVFGMSKTYTQAVCGRIISGLLSGNIGISKCFLTEITDDSNRGLAFSYMALGWAAGIVIGPLVGGLLAKPTHKYSHTLFPESGFFGDYPYVLPCLVCVALNIIVAFLCMVFMEESLASKVGSSRASSGTNSTLKAPDSRGGLGKGYEKVLLEERDMEESEIELSSVSFRSPLHHDSSIIHVPLTDESVSSSDAIPLSNTTTLHEEGFTSKENELLDSFATYDSVLEEPVGSSSTSTEVCSSSAHGQDDDSDEEELCFLCMSGKRSHESNSEEIQLSTEYDEEMGQVGGLSAKPRTQALHKKLVWMVTCNYALLAMGQILLDETIPLLLKLDENEGGFSFSSSEIGLMFASGGAAMMVFTSLFLPYFAKQSKRWLFSFGMGMSVPMTIIWPCVAVLNVYLVHQHHKHSLDADFVPYNETDTYKYGIWPLLLFCYVFKTVFLQMTFTAVMIQINHAVFPRDLGVVNGLGQSLASLARAVGPALGGAMWSVSSAAGFTFLNFIIVCIVYIGAILLNRSLPLALDHNKVKKKRSSVPDELLMQKEAVTKQEKYNGDQDGIIAQ